MDYIECHEGFMKIERILNFPQKIIHFCRIRGKLWSFLLLIPGILEVFSVIGSAATVFTSKGDSKVFAVAAIFAIAHAQVAVKSFSILLDEGAIVGIFQWFHQLHQTRKEEIVHQIFKDNLEKAQKLTYNVIRILLFVFMMTFLTISIYFNMSDKLYTKYPLIPESADTIHRTINVILLIFTVVILATSECTLIVFGIYFIASLNILSDLIRKLNESSYIPSARNFLRIIVELQIQILTNLEVFCTLFFFVFIVQISTSVGLLLFNFSLIVHSLTDFIYYSMISSSLSQFAFYCLFGQIINGKSERIFTDLYQTMWYEMPIREQKILLLMLKMSQKTFTLKAAGMYDINMIMFVQVIKLCFSYCTILYALM
uniref:Odorant receptor n=1 Tax=Lutzomyia longipalpis TaxID=7200 RepID=A0A3F2ZDF6_LUTLO